MTETLPRLLLQLSESGDPAILWGRQARPYFGKDFERLLNCRLLVEEARAEEWDVCDACDCDHGVRLIQESNGQFIAACPVDQRSDSVLDPDDLRSFRVNAAALVAEVAKASGFGQEPTQVMPGVWRLGVTGMKRMMFLALERNSVLTPGLVETLRVNDEQLPITLLAPTARPQELLPLAASGIHCIKISDAFPADGAPFAIDMAKMAPAASVRSRLTLYRPNSRLVFDGDELELSPINFQFLWLLAEQASREGGLLDRRQIETTLWSTTVSRTAVADAVRNLRAVLKKIDRKDRPTSSLIKNITNQGYVLDLAAGDIRLVS